jgi:hypothetical protein
MKPVLDGLVDSEILIDDNMSVVGSPTYIWAKAKRGQGRSEFKWRNMNRKFTVIGRLHW